MEDERWKIEGRRLKMMTLYTHIVMLFICLLVVQGRVYGQTVATGHVTAEIVESVSATSPKAARFGLSAESVSAALTTGEAGGSMNESLDLGEMSVRSGVDVAFQCVTANASMTDAAGNIFSIEPQINGLASNVCTGGDQTIYIKGVAQVANSQASGIYRGAYTLVLAYN